uniref:Testis cDNA clone: QtsA-14047, similar to human hypothetical protein MGC35206 (MGC35206) n=1 Tax=Macaca fascicularis TaxID=9541 RepID=Q4R7Z0_MACFA|nr:unnamed protein product [Macaca fascicularis]
MTFPAWGPRTRGAHPRTRRAASFLITFATSLGATWWASWSPRSRLKGLLMKPSRARRRQAHGPAGPRILWKSPPSSQTTMISATTCGQTCFKGLLRRQRAS